MVMPPSRVSSASDPANCCTCLVKGSAQTEQMAAIFSRCRCMPFAFSSSCARATIFEERSAQSGR